MFVFELRYPRDLCRAIIFNPTFLRDWAKK